ncbi:MAG: CopZ family metallochaperone [Planctomycetota bacterium]|jgi:copper chaperone
MITIRITGMSCGHCVKSVTEALSQVPGVSRVVEVNLDKGEAHVEGDPDPADVLSAVEEAGFSGEVLS